MQKGYVGLTDPDWYRYLAGRPTLDEVNFLQPRGGRTFRAIGRGDPFLFKLRAPAKAIVGFGFFERFEILPAWLAWELFGDRNGAADFDGMLDRIIRLPGEDSPRSGEFPIGCIMLTAPIMLPELATRQDLEVLRAALSRWFLPAIAAVLGLLGYVTG